MKPDSDESTSQNIVGAKKEYDRLYRVTISGNTDMYRVLLSSLKVMVVF